jgi:hypothetical protein
MASEHTAVMDADGICFTCAAAGEKRSIVVTHKNTLEQWKFDNRQQFWGKKRSRDGGELAILNEGRDSPYSWEEFVITDVQTVEPIENILHSTKLTFNRWLDALGTKKYKAFIGGEGNFRVERSTLLKYKNDRDQMIKPLSLPEVQDYLVKKFKAERTVGIESDDAVIIEAYGKKDHVVQTYDKDAYGQPVLVLNMIRPEEGIINCNQFGKLWLNDKKEVRGYGRKFLYWQTLNGDSSDFYKANCFSDIKWADMAAYNQLKDSTNDKEAFESLISGFKLLYPEPKKVIGWREKEIDIDWLYVAQEMFTMARMLRYKDEPEIKLVDVFNKLGIDYGN